jgi:hypothetical protein
MAVDASWVYKLQLSSTVSSCGRCRELASARISQQGCLHFVSLMHPVPLLLLLLLPLLLLLADH